MQEFYYIEKNIIIFLKYAKKQPTYSLGYLPIERRCGEAVWGSACYELGKHEITAICRY